MKTLFRPNRPFDPGRFPIYYGWVILVTGTLGILATLPGQTIGVGPFTESLLRQLDLERDQLSFAYLVGTLGSSYLLPKVGRVFDEIGVRPIAFVAFLGFGLALLFLSRVEEVYRVLAPGGQWMLAWCLITIGYFLIRFLGQGTLTMVCRAMLGKWFNRQRGLISAISGIVVSAGFASSPGWLFRLIHWQGLGSDGAWLLLGAIMVLVMAPLALLFFRDNPEECGLLMDDPRARQADDGGPANPEFTIFHEFSAEEAGRTYAFWITCLSAAFLAYFGTALPFHGEDLALEAGMPPADFFELFLKTVPVQVVATFAAGWMCGKIRMKWVMVSMLGAIVASSVGLILLPSTLGLVLFVGGNGIAWGAFGPITTVTFPRFFGRRHLGATSGRLMVFMVVASAMGPYAFALIQKTTGSYRLAAVSFSVLAVALFVAAFWVENPQRRLAKPTQAPTE